MIYKLVSSKEVIRKVFRDLRPSHADFIHDAVEWIGEALEHIGASAQLCKKLCIVDIHNHRGKLPSDMYSLNMVAINTCIGSSESSNVSEVTKQIAELKADIQSYNQQVTNTITLSTNGTYVSTLTPSDLADFDSYHASNLSKLTALSSQLAVMQNNWFSNSGSCLQPLGWGTSEFHAGYGCPECAQPQHKHTFTVNCGQLQTSFEKGQVCISHMAFPTDKDCWPMVPDNISYREAMFWYITKKLLLQGLTLQNNQITYAVAEQMWLKFCTQARNSAVFPDISKAQSFMDQWVRLVPDMNRDLTFFSSLNDRETL